MYPLNAPAAVQHAGPDFELQHNLYVYILLINLAKNVVLRAKLYLRPFLRKSGFLDLRKNGWRYSLALKTSF